MKTKVIFLLIIVLTKLLAAQEVKTFGGGIKAGLNNAWLLNEEDFDTSTKLGLLAGAFVNYHLGGAITLQVEALYTMKGTRTPRQNFGSVTVPETRLNLNYLEIPVLAKLALSSSKTFKPFIVTGPAFGFLSHSEMVLEERHGRDTKIDIEDFVRDRETSWVIGLAVNQISAENQPALFFEFRYTIGLTPVFNADPDDADFDDKNQMVAVILGIEF